MKIKLKLNIFTFFFNLIIFLIGVKLFFSYLAIRLSYFQRHLTPEFERYNFLGLPRDFSSKIEFILFPFLLLFVLMYSNYAKKVRPIIIVTFLMYTINIITSIYNNVSLVDSLNFSIKISSPIYFFCVLLIYNGKNRISLKKLLVKTIYFCIILTIIAVLFFNPTYNRLKDYLPIFFDSIHTHNYILSIVFASIGYFLYRKEKGISLIAFLTVSFLFLLIGYNIRTVLIVYLIYSITLVFLVSNIFKVLFVKVLVFVPLFVILFLFIRDQIDFTQVSSGRTSMYLDKINQLSEYNFFEWLFGKGYGSDLIQTKIWWWEKKGAHSDLFTFLIENGLIYLLLFILLYALIFRLSGKINLIYGSLLIGSFFSSTISNGLSVRPAANYIFYLLLAHILIDLKKRQEKSLQE